MLKDKKILLLGASGGIGKEIQLCLQNYNGLITSPSHAELDLADEKSIIKYFSNNNAEYDIIVYSAGINNPTPIENVTTEQILHTLSVNTLGFVRVCQEILPKMKQSGSGRIVVISSLYGVISRKKRLPYALSKHALTGVVQTLALEFAPFNILVNAISPGFIKTDLTFRNNSPERIQELKKDIPLGKLGEGVDVGEVVAFLCSDKNKYITGQNIIVDGGIMAGGWQNE
jgi:3-oxoacyl-[acyl-carrier protein] reductase